MILHERAVKWAKALSDSARGPLLIAGEVCEVADAWKEYKEEAGGMGPSAWLDEKCGHNLAWFRRRAKAVEKLGNDAKRVLDHRVAVWIVNNVPEESYGNAMMIMASECRRFNGNPPGYQRATELLAKKFGRKHRRSTQCERCAKLEAQLIELGHFPFDWEDIQHDAAQ